MGNKRIGILFGAEDIFPWALIREINGRGGREVEAAPVEISCVIDEALSPYDLILDRISHQVPFYRTMLKCAAAAGVAVVNNPFWWSADDKFFDNIIARAAGVAVPRTVLLPHKHHPATTREKSFRNMKWVDWEKVFDYLKFPVFLKPAYGGGWKNVWKADDPEQFFAAYDQTRDLCMMAQESIDFTDYYRCWVAGRSRVRVMLYDPKVPFHSRYVPEPSRIEPEMHDRMVADAVVLCEALGYDMNTVEFAIRDGVPYAIDFMNCAPDADPSSLGEENFKWVVENMADFLIERVRNPRPLELTGTWPRLLERR